MRNKAGYISKADPELARGQGSVGWRRAFRARSRSGRYRGMRARLPSRDHPPVAVGQVAAFDQSDDFGAMLVEMRRRGADRQPGSRKASADCEGDARPARSAAMVMTMSRANVCGSGEYVVDHGDLPGRNAPLQEGARPRRPHHPPGALSVMIFAGRSGLSTRSQLRRKRASQPVPAGRWRGRAL
ncbi:hypothetical protein F2981_25395 (plasmid) [Sinorhizobium meliloti]|nr:hypothetical protein [Sinorhizobium meliloti]